MRAKKALCLIVFNLALHPNAFAESFRTDRLSDGRVVIVTESNELIPETDLVRSCSTDQDGIRAAGWRFHAPVPKSAQAAWGNQDRRTTWFYGYWTDGRSVSHTVPRVRKFGSRCKVFGDGVDNRGYYRNGGSPAPLTQIEIDLCTNCG